ncbi:MAG: acyl carrier protein [Rhodobacterales bacterium]|nr:acyl carrier protein [Rhodobacterales bacterium]
MTNQVTEDLMALIVREMKIDPASINATTPLFEGGLELDSFAVVDLVSRIENRFGFQLADADFRPENFADIQTLGGVVARYISAKT